MAVAAAPSRPSVTLTIQAAIPAASDGCPACTSTRASWQATSVLSSALACAAGPASRKNSSADDKSPAS